MTWKLTLPCTRGQADIILEDYEWLASFDPAPTVVAEELEAFNDAKWQLHAYFEREPEFRTIRSFTDRIAGANAEKMTPTEIDDEDWLLLSQQGLRPVHAGRFFIHTSAFSGEIPGGSKPFQIEASQAFGTGGHDTTAGCLNMLDGLKRRGKQFRRIADIGTGTGLLAFAALHLWRKAYVTASDIDPVSVAVTRQNAEINAVPVGQEQGRLALCVAMGTNHPVIQERAPYDLITANILAGPLIELAPDFAQIVADGGHIILAGLLNTQCGRVLHAYKRFGFRLVKRADSGDWPCLCLVKRSRPGHVRPVRGGKGTSQPPGDFGTW
jgi:ribosomal protein L11 methyltransferase